MLQQASTVSPTKGEESRRVSLEPPATAGEPAERNRVADFLRAASIGVVVLGHWLIVVIRVSEGRLEGSFILEEIAWTRLLTWVCQVMPLFFFVGGYANATGLTKAAERGQTSVDWLRARARRLLRPTVPLLVVWAPLAVLLPHFGLDAAQVQLVTRVVLIPTWFLVAYLMVIAIAPATLWLHRRLGAAVLFLLLAAAALFDVLHRLGVPLVGWSNYLWVWAAVHQLGYFWHDERLPKGRAAGLAISAVGLLALFGFVHFLGYPVSMVGGETAQGMRSNSSPPAFILVILAFTHIGLVIAFEDTLRRWLDRRRVYAVVGLIGSRIMTLYLWHMTALVSAAALIHGSGVWNPRASIDGAWWLTRPLWFLILSVLLIPLVMIFGRFERATPARPTLLRGGTGMAVAFVSVALTCSGLGLLVTRGMTATSGPSLLGVSLVPIGLWAVGLVGLGVLASGPLATLLSRPTAGNG